jgi:hypothetical protein
MLHLQSGAAGEMFAPVGAELVVSTAQARLAAAGGLSAGLTSVVVDASC